MLLLRAVKGFPVQFSENGNAPQVQVLRTGKFKHPVYGDFEITPTMLAEMKANFDSKVRGIDLALDYFHESDREASGWIKALELKEGGTQLWAFVEWTPAATEKIKNKELRYFSPDFAFQWSDPETGAQFNNVLFGGGLTNRPFVKEMAAIAAVETIKKGTKMNEKEIKEMQAKLVELEASNVKLGEDKAALQKQMADASAMAAPAGDEMAALKAENEKLKAELEAMKASNATMAEQMKVADEAKKMAEKEAAFTVLLTEGKACVAQKAAFISGDMAEFIKLAQPLNLVGTGNAGTENEDHETKVLKLASFKQKEDSKLSRGEAISLALNEIK